MEKKTSKRERDSSFMNSSPEKKLKPLKSGWDIPASEISKKSEKVAVSDSRTKLFISCAGRFTKDDLLDQLESFGDVLIENITKNVGIVSFHDRETAILAQESLNGLTFYAQVHAHLAYFRMHLGWL